MVETIDDSILLFNKWKPNSVKDFSIHDEISGKLQQLILYYEFDKFKVEVYSKGGRDPWYEIKSNFHRLSKSLEEVYNPQFLEMFKDGVECMQNCIRTFNQILGTPIVNVNDYSFFQRGVRLDLYIDNERTSLFHKDADKQIEIFQGILCDLETHLKQDYSFLEEHIGTMPFLGIPMPDTFPVKFKQCRLQNGLYLNPQEVGSESHIILEIQGDQSSDFDEHKKLFNSIGDFLNQDKYKQYLKDYSGRPYQVERHDAFWDINLSNAKVELLPDNFKNYFALPDKSASSDIQ